jgi:hypothetical protein
MQRMMLEPPPAYSGFLDGAGGQAYNQAAFRHFLAIERRRAERSMRSVLLVLVSVRNSTRVGANLPVRTAAAIFRGLGESVREVDFVGWFREGRVAGAVLAEGKSTASDQTRQLMAERVTRTLVEHLPAHEAKNVRVRVLQLAPPGAMNREQPEARALSGY